MFRLLFLASCLQSVVSLNQLQALISQGTSISIDSGSISTIREVTTRYPNTISDATTNPLFVAQIVSKLDSSSDPDSALCTSLFKTACKEKSTELAIDKLSVLLGIEISKIVPGFISTEVDPRLSFSVAKQVERARHIISLYEASNIAKSRVLIKLAATWEGIQAATILKEDYEIQCNLTLIFGMTQAVACGQRNLKLISPFPGRVLDYHNDINDREFVASIDDDEGVQLVKGINKAFAEMSSSTINMPASWRPSRGARDDGFYDKDEILGLSGATKMTIPSNFLERLGDSEKKIKYSIHEGIFTPNPHPTFSPKLLTEEEFRLHFNYDACATSKFSEGLTAFCKLTDELENAIEQEQARS